MKTLDCLVYVSRAKLSADERSSQLADIVKVSAYRNADTGITGILALQDGRFIQLLEGAPSALDLLMLHLHFDKRHEDIRVLAREAISDKAVTGWSMISPPEPDMPHIEIGRLLADPAASIAPWRTALLDMLGVPA